MDNSHEKWIQGHFVDHPRYRHWSQADKNNAAMCEKLKVRPSPTGNAICYCPSQEEAKWIATRLNIAAKLEKKINKNLNRKADYMPMSFPDMKSLLSAADVHKFRKPNKNETEIQYRNALADHVRDRDFVESEEIRCGAGWDQWDEGQKRAALGRSGLIL